MNKFYKKILGMAMASAMIISTAGTAMPVRVMAETSTEQQQTVEPGVSSTLGMFKIAKSTVTVNKNATVSVEMTTAPVSSRVYNKIALTEQTSSIDEKESKAIIGVLNDDNSTTFKFDISVDQIGKDLPLSTYQTNAEASEWHDWTEQKYIKIENTVSVVDQLIAAIYVQERDEYTDTLCTASKNCWDALSDEQKKAVEEADYYALDTGDASKDDPLNANKIGKKELLVVSFGTSFNDSRVATIGAVEKALQAKYPKYSVRRAFTAQIIINHIQSRDGEKIDNVEQALDRAVKNGVKELVVQPTHLMSGAEYDEMKAIIDKYAKKITVIKYAKPLLDSDSDKTDVVKAVTAAAAKDAGFNSVAEADEKTAFVFMGHGTEHAAQVTYTKMQNELDKMGYKNCFIGTVEGKPEMTECKEVIERVIAGGYTNVILRPLMVVAGDHANNDMAGDDEDSWKTMFAKAGLKVTCQINGLGELGAVQKVYVAHAAKAVKEAEKLTKEINTVTSTTITGVKAVAKKNKDHSVTVSWKKNSKVSGYKIYCSKKKNGTYGVVSTTKVSRVKFGNRKAGNVFYVKLRGYKKIDGKTYYTKYSKTVKVKTK